MYENNTVWSLFLLTEKRGGGCEMTSAVTYVENTNSFGLFHILSGWDEKCLAKM